MPPMFWAPIPQSKLHLLIIDQQQCLYIGPLLYLQCFFVHSPMALCNSILVYDTPTIAFNASSKCLHYSHCSPVSMLYDFLLVFQPASLQRASLCVLYQHPSTNVLWRPQFKPFYHAHCMLLPIPYVPLNTSLHFNLQPLTQSNHIWDIISANENTPSRWPLHEMNCHKLISIMDLSPPLYNKSIHDLCLASNPLSFFNWQLWALGWPPSNPFHLATNWDGETCPLFEFLILIVTTRWSSILLCWCKSMKKEDIISHHVVWSGLVDHCLWSVTTPGCLQPCDLSPSLNTSCIISLWFWNAQFDYPII